MFAWILRKLLGTKNERELKKLRPRVAAINELDDRMRKLTDPQLQAKTAEFKQKLENGASLDDILVEAFAVCREASRRVLKMRHFDVQLIGGMTLHKGMIAEMRTGEGKTLVATLPAYLNALTGLGVHVVTVNDYLAKRDAEWMGRLYNFLGLSVGTVVNAQSDLEKFKSYRADITYGQNNEFGFDYLRDNMKDTIFECAQRKLNYAIVDEVDSILIDEARTPLIISGQGEASTELYVTINKIIPYLRKDEHFILDEKAHQVTLTDEGIDEAERRLKLKNLYDPENIESLHILQQCLRAHKLYKRNVNYLVSDDGKVNIIDEFTGRVLAGRRWSDGLHQAVEAKEFVKVQEENRTLATITFQNLFRLYNKLSGMTGTAETEAEEFHSIYKLEVLPIPTNRSVSRMDYDDLVYANEKGKFRAVVEEIAEAHEKGQPVLVGTTSVSKSEALSMMLTERKIHHEVLNAKQHEREAFIVAQAGKRGSVTVATNMAGRGTDIVLGGNPEMLAKWEFIRTKREASAPENKEEFERLVEEFQKSCEEEKKLVLEAGGLHIVGTERHESRRIDNQLRGRSGRQGDPGSSRFFLSLEDDLMRIFAGERVQNVMRMLGMEEDVPIEHTWVTSSIADAQRKVEARNFDIRKSLLDYDDVMNQQRKAVYFLRREVLEGKFTGLKNSEGEERDPGELDEAAEKRVREACENVFKRFRINPESIENVRNAKADNRSLRPELPPAEKLDEVKAIDPWQVEQALYHSYGVPVNLDEMFDDVPAALDHAVEEVVWTLRLQRERLLESIDSVVSHMVATNANERAQRDDWNVVGMANQFTERFGRVTSVGEEKNESSIVQKKSDDENSDKSESEPKESAAEEAVRLGRPVVHGLAPEAWGIYELIESMGTREDMVHCMFHEAEKLFLAKEKESGTEMIIRVFRGLVLSEIDRAWVDHLTNMDHLRDGIGLRGYGQRDPKLEYKKEGFEMFSAMMASVNASVIQNTMHVAVQRPQDIERLEREEQRRAAARQRSMQAVHADAHELPQEGTVEQTVNIPQDVYDQLKQLGMSDQDIAAAVMQAQQQSGQAPAGGAGGAGRPSAAPAPPPEKIESVRRAQPKVGRNDPCPCGSGKKYKKCHGSEDQSTA